jgi:hypothetical protein
MKVWMNRGSPSRCSGTQVASRRIVTRCMTANSRELECLTPQSLYLSPQSS